jgi:signal transduction histidine kinase/pSer/pThr/pTyr-binding forkhead associated (FHA) protein
VNVVLQIFNLSEYGAFFTIGSTLTIIPVETIGYNLELVVSYRCSICYMAILTVIRGIRTGHQFQLGDGKRKIGRESQCDIHFSDTETSRNHAEIEGLNGEFRLRDLGSSNGTFVNQQRVSESLLHHGDRIQIGRQTLLFIQRLSPTEARPKTIEIIPALGGEASQIVGRMSAADDSSNDQTADWRSAIIPVSTPESLNAVTPGHEKSLWEILYRTSLAVSRTLDIDQLLAQILDLIFQWIECDRGCIMLTDFESGDLRPACRKDRKHSRNDRLTISRTILDYVTQHGEGVLTSDAHDDVRWNPSASISADGVREAICVPMKGRYDTVGVIYIDTMFSAGRYAKQADHIFNQEHLKLLVAIGHQAALAIEDTFFYQNMVQAERLAVMGQTIATLSHHIKNIVQGLKGGGYLVQEGINAQELPTIQRGWQICAKNQERIENLVLDMLTMSKDRVPMRRNVSLNQLISDVVQLAKSRAEETKVDLKWSPISPDIIHSIEEEAIHRALLNLVVNAIDACRDRENSIVTVMLHSDHKHSRIAVSDNGIGIPLTQQKKVFSMFESNKGSRGTGLGLPVSLKIAEEHGGTIHVESEEGKGTTFELILPKSEPIAASNEAEKTLFE